MMKSTARTSVQRMGNGTYRVGTSGGRSAISGRFITKPQATKQPATTVKESPKK